MTGFRWYGIGVNGWPVFLYVADIGHVAPAGCVLAKILPRRVMALTREERRSS